MVLPRHRTTFRDLRDDWPNVTLWSRKLAEHELWGAMNTWRAGTEKQGWKSRASATSVRSSKVSSNEERRVGSIVKHVCAYRGQSAILGVFLSHFTLYFLRQSLSRSKPGAHQSSYCNGQQVSWILLLPPPQHHDYKGTLLCLKFLPGFWGSNTMQGKQFTD